MPFSVRGLLLVIVTCGLAWPTSWAETPQPDLSIVTDNGWTLIIKADGSALLARTRSPQLQANAPAATFAYVEIVKALEKGTALTDPPLPGGGYSFATQTSLAPLPRIPEVTALLTQAQSVFRTSVQPLLRQLLSQYPLITQGDPR